MPSLFPEIRMTEVLWYDAYGRRIEPPGLSEPEMTLGELDRMLESDGLRDAEQAAQIGTLSARLAVATAEILKMVQLVAELKLENADLKNRLDAIACPVEVEDPPNERFGMLEIRDDEPEA